MSIETITTPSRGRGRPAMPETELRRQVLDAATALLLDQGYQAATIEAVAKAAGVAKKTVYRFAPNSEALLGAIIRGWTDALAEALDAPTDGPAEETLEALLLLIARRVLSPQAVGLFKLLTHDFPGREEALRGYHANGIQRSAGLLAGWLQRQDAAGHLRIAQPGLAAEMLLAMAIAEPLRQMALGLCLPCPDYDPAPRIRAAVGLCLRGAAG